MKPLLCFSRYLFVIVLQTHLLMATDDHVCQRNQLKCVTHTAQDV